jgi:hypothetical protein
LQVYGHILHLYSFSPVCLTWNQTENKTRTAHLINLKVSSDRIIHAKLQIKKTVLDPDSHKIDQEFWDHFRAAFIGDLTKSEKCRLVSCPRRVPSANQTLGNIMCNIMIYGVELKLSR